MTVMIRRATLRDVRGIAFVHLTSWRTAYSDFVPAEHLAKKKLFERVWFWQMRLLRGMSVHVVDDASQIVGFCAFGKANPPDAVYTGEIYNLHLLPNQRGRGLGSQLVRRAAAELQAAGHTHFLLGVFADNRNARIFYEKIGGVLVAEIESKFDTYPLKEVVYGYTIADLLAKGGEA
ncbi:MAG: GNAT family N-acetyltransferase [Anaerolineae bacterium]